MKLTGNKLIALALGLATASAPTIAANEPSLTTFTSGTPAKAQEVNANFEASVNYTTRSAAELTLKIEGVEKSDAESTADLLAQIEALKTRLTALDGQGGKTEEFTQAFNELDNRVDVLEAKIQALEAQSNNTEDEYNIAVWGDCDGECTEDNLIGYAKDLPGLLEMSSDANTGIHLMNQQHGLIALNQILKYENDIASLAGYSLNSVEPTNGFTINNSTLYYQDDQCIGTPYYAARGEGLITITEESKLQNEQIVTGYHNQVIYKTNSSLLSTTVPTLYAPNWEGICSEIIANTRDQVRFIIPLVELTKKTHGLKSKYSSIQINGFQVLE